MPIFRVEKNTNYTTMSNFHLRDKKLSMRAKGLLSMCLSLPDNWDYSVRGLVSLCKEGRDAVIAVLQEMEECGYLEREQSRLTDGRLGKVTYVIYEKPVSPHTEKPCTESPCTEKPTTVKPTTEKPTTEKPTTEEPTTDKPDTASPFTENPTQLNKEVINTKELNTDSTNKGKKEVRHKYGTYGNVLLSDEELATLQREFPFDWQMWIERVSEYVASSGKSYKNFLATIRNWARKDVQRSMPTRYNYDRFPRTEEDSL